MEFGYWAIKGRAEAIRWLIAYIGADVKEWNPSDFAAWNARKQEIGPFANLPFLIDGDVKITESSAIPSYIILKSGKTELLGKEIQDRARVREIDGVINDINLNFMKILGAGPDFTGAVVKALSSSSQTVSKITQLSAFLGEKDYLVGYLTWADLKFVESARLVQAFAISFGQPCPFANHTNLEKLIKRVEELPGIQQRVEAAKAFKFFLPQYVQFPLKTQAEF